MKKIAIIGAGVAGVTTAYELARKGFDVTVFDRQRYAAMETSFANGGSFQRQTLKPGPSGARCSRA